MSIFRLCLQYSFCMRYKNRKYRNYRFSSLFAMQLEWVHGNISQNRWKKKKKCHILPMKKWLITEKFLNLLLIYQNYSDLIFELHEMEFENAGFEKRWRKHQKWKKILPINKLIVRRRGIVVDPKNKKQSREEEDTSDIFKIWTLM